MCKIGDTMKKIIIGTFIAMTLTGTAMSCFRTKQCCKRDYQGNLQCVTKCDYMQCPYNFPQEIR